jgi:hypothetical protein
VLALRACVGAQALCALHVLREEHGIGRIQHRGGAEQLRALGAALEQAVDQQQIRRRTIAHDVRIGLIEDRGGEVVSEAVRGLRCDGCATRQAGCEHEHERAGDTQQHETPAVSARWR